MYTQFDGANHMMDVNIENGALTSIYRSIPSLGFANAPAETRLNNFNYFRTLQPNDDQFKEYKLYIEEPSIASRKDKCRSQYIRY